MSDATTVISVRGKDRDALLADPAFLYIGRGVYRGKLNWKGSDWANPFAVGSKRHAAIRILGRDIDSEPRAETLGVELCLRFYSAWLRERSGLTERLPELRGRVLGCWCACWSPGDPPIPCHGWVLATRADALEAISR